LWRASRHPSLGKNRRCFSKPWKIIGEISNPWKKHLVSRSNPWK
jgi:hypothetical protein